MRGLFMVDRDFFGHPSFADEPYTERLAFIWMIAEACHTAGAARTRKGVVHLKRGQLTASTRFMAEKWGWNKAKVERFLRRLKTETMIETETGTGQLVITVCNYEKYQDHNLKRAMEEVG